MSKQEQKTKLKVDVKKLRAEFDENLRKCSTEKLLEEFELLSAKLSQSADLTDSLWIQAKDTKLKFVKFECEQALDLVINARQELKSAHNTLKLELNKRLDSTEIDLSEINEPIE